MGAFDILSRQNGLKTTQNVLTKQQSGQDAAQKAEPQTAQQINMNTAKAMMQGKTVNPAPPKDAHEQAEQQNMQTAEGMMNGQIPIIKKEEPPKQKSYAEMYKELFGDGNSPEQDAKQERRERTRAVISAVGDGLRALSNMYFASKGAMVKHDPNSDLSAAVAKRRQQIDSMREKNKASWVSGYQKALALDEEQRNNEAKLAETVRYHDQLAKNRERVGDQTDTKLDQNQQKIDLAKLKYTTDAEYKNQLLEIRRMVANGQLSHWAAQDAMARLREQRLAAKADSASGGNKTTAGYWYEYYDMMDTPEGQKKIDELQRKLKIKKVTQSNVRYLMDRLKGRHSEGAPADSGGGKPKTPQKSNPAPKKKGNAKSNFSIHK